MVIVPGWVLAEPRTARVEEGHAVAVEDGRVAAVGPAEAILAARPGAARIDLAGAVLMPGLVNAHQHGRGLSQIQLGYPDLPLERWINARRRRGAPDGGAFTRLAAAAMIENGVTSAVHANYAYGTGDYEAEVRAQLAAYLDSGMRVTFCVGAQDRGFVVYPPYGTDDLGPLPESAMRIVRSARSPYAPDTPALLALMDRLLDDFGDHPRVTLCWGPAGPQWVSDALMTAVADHARANGLGIHMHCLESPAQAAVCARLYPEGTLRRLKALGALGPRTVLAHAVHMTDDDIAVAAESEAMVVHNPGSNLRLSNGVAPVARLVAAGVPVAVGTDNTAVADDEDLLGEMRQMATLARTPHRGAVRFSAATLLAAVTAAGARAMMQDGALGRIAPGCPADLVALDLGAARGAFLDPDTPLADAIAFRARGRDARLVMVDGRILWRDGVHPSLDRAAAERAAAEDAARTRLSANPQAEEAVAALDAALSRLYGI